MASYEWPKGVKVRHPLDWDYASAYMGSFTAIGDHTNTYAVGLYNSGSPNDIIKVYSVSGIDQTVGVTIALYIVKGKIGTVQQQGVPMVSSGPQGCGQITVGEFNQWPDVPQGFGWQTFSEAPAWITPFHPLGIITPGYSLLIVSQDTTQELVAGFCWLELPFPLDSQVTSSSG